MHLIVKGRPYPKVTMTAHQAKVAKSSSYRPKSKQEADKLSRVKNTLVYQELIAWHVKQALMKGAKAVEGYAKLTVKIFYQPDAKGKLPEDRGDLDNLMKSITDGLQYGGAFAPKKGCKKGNDKAVILFGEGTGIYLDQDERVEITLEPV